MRRNQWLLVVSVLCASFLVYVYISETSLERILFSLLQILAPFRNAAADQSPTLQASSSSTHGKFAYVFYVTNDIYTCYALANADRLINRLSIGSNVDIVLITMAGVKLDSFCSQKCLGDRLKLKTVPVPPALTTNERYKHCYVRFEAFKLIEYERIVIMDADGVAVKNMDHLFLMDLDGFDAAAAYTAVLKKWLDSILFVIKPSMKLYGRVKPYLSPENITKVAQFANGPHFDMDLLNLIFDRGEGLKVLPKWYAVHDHQFNEGVLSKVADYDKVFYVHFTSEKPFQHWERRTWPNTFHYLRALPGGFLYRLLWIEYNKYCMHLSRNALLTLPAMVEKDQGFYYPDPKDMMDYLKNSSDYLVESNKIATDMETI